MSACACERCGCKRAVSDNPSELTRAYRQATENRQILYGSRAQADISLMERTDLCVDCRVGVHTCRCQCGCGVAGVQWEPPVNAICVACENGSHRDPAA